MRIALLVAIAFVGCVKQDARTDAGPGETRVAAAKKPPKLVKGASSPTIPKFVTAAVAQSKAEGRKTLVYIGATWCEPCQRFHKALEKGELDSELADVDFIEFDLDEHRDALLNAGYRSKYIPLFVKPDAEGRGSSVRVEGAPKGEGAVADLAPRLKTLLGD